MKRLLTALALVMFIACPALAAYPDKPISMIIPFSAGGSSDVQARVMQKYWDKYSNAKWNFIYKAGAGGAIGFGEIAKARPNGYTIGGANTPHIMIQPLTQHAQFNIKDFAYLCQVVNDPTVVAVSKKSPFNSVKEIIEYAQKNPEKLKVGMIGPNSGHQLMFFKLASTCNLPITEVYYKGIEQNAALMGGEIDMMFGNLNDVMRNLEQIKILAVAANARHELLPDCPTMKELGYDVENYIRRCYVAPKKIGKKQLKYLRSVFDKIGADPEYIQDMKKAGQPHDYMTGDALEKWVFEENARVETLLKKFNKLSN